jgi:hypothetical protein
VIASSRTAQTIDRAVEGYAATDATFASTREFADGTLNSSTSFGKGSIAFAVNGAPFGSQKIGLNQSIAVGSGNNAFAGFNDRSGRFAAAVGRQKTADDGINNGVK